MLARLARASRRFFWGIWSRGRGHVDLGFLMNRREHREHRERRVRLRIFATEVEELVLLKVLWVQLSMVVQTCRC